MTIPPVFLIMGLIATVCEIIIVAGVVRKFPVLGAAFLTALVIMGVNALVIGGTS
jgi:hypothetical protein